jgi:hypothetical protein
MAYGPERGTGSRVLTHATSNTVFIQTVEVLVVAPRDFEVWAERGGQAVTTRIRIRLDRS